MIRIAVLGCGRIGAMHAANIAAHPSARLAAVQDINGAAAQAAAASTGARVIDTASEVFSSPDVDAVLIATATDTHCGLLEQAVAAGKPVLCEKPIDLSLARVNRYAAAIRGVATPIQIGFVRRFDPGHKAVHDAVRAGDIGDLYQVVITSRDPGLAPEAHLKVSGGILRDMTIHDFDMARFILGEEPEVVTATGSRLMAPALMEKLGDCDTVTVVMTTASGKQASSSTRASLSTVTTNGSKLSAPREWRCLRTADRTRCCCRPKGSAITPRPFFTFSSSATERRLTPKSTLLSKLSRRISPRSLASTTDGERWCSQRRRSSRSRKAAR